MNQLVNHRRARGFVLALAAAAVVALAPAYVVAQGDSPMETVRKTLSASNKIVTGTGDHNTKLAKLKELLRGFLDTDALGYKSIGKHIDGKTEAQKREFLDLFRELFIRTYVQRLLLFEAPDFEYGAEKVSGDKATVNTFIVTPRDKFAVDYDLERKSKGWIATDIRIEGVSLAENFKSQFDRALAKRSFDELLTQLRNKLKSGDSSGGTD